MPPVATQGSDLRLPKNSVGLVSVGAPGVPGLGLAAAQRGAVVEAERQSAATIESAKWVGPFVVPFASEVLAVNAEAFAADILIANKDPYEAGWLVQVRPLDPATATEGLLSGAAAVAHFQQRIRDNNIRCYRCVDEPMPEQ